MARERYLLDNQEEAINKPGAEIKADTQKSKLQNFWYYYKYILIFGIIGCLLVGWFIHDMVSKVNPDYQIGLISQETYSDDILQGLQKEIAKYGKDVNGDGKVIVQINMYPLSNDSTKVDQATQAYTMKLTADIASATSLIFLTDDTSFTVQQKGNAPFAYNDGTTPPKGANDYDKMRVSFDKCKVLSQLKISSDKLTQSGVQNLLSKLSISLRVSPSGKSGEDKSYTQAKALFNKLAYDK